MLESMQKNYYQIARQFREANIRRDITTLEEFKQLFTPKNAEKPEIHGGFVLAKWCGEEETEKMLERPEGHDSLLAATAKRDRGKCILTGRKATLDVIFAKSY